MVGAFAMTLAWGYEQRLQAQEWRELACAYRVADVANRAKFLGLDDQGRACERLHSLGLSVRTSGLSALTVRQPFRY